MDYKQQRRAEHEFITNYWYMELEYLYLTFVQFLKENNIKQRILYCPALEIIAGFKNHIEKQLSYNCTTDDFNLLESNVVTATIANTQDIKMTYILGTFTGICSSSLETDAQNRIYVPTWLKTIREMVTARCMEYMHQYDYYRKLVWKSLIDEKAIMPESLSVLAKRVQSSNINTEQQAEAARTETKTEESAVEIQEQPKGITLKEYLTFIGYTEHYWLNLEFEDEKKAGLYCAVKDAITAFEHGDRRGDEILKPGCIKMSEYKVSEYNSAAVDTYGMVNISVKL